MNASVSSLGHLLIFLLWSFGVYTDTWLLDPPFNDHYDFEFNLFGGRLKYLTIVNSLLQCGYFGLCVVNDLIGSEAKARAQQSSIQNVRDWLFTTLVFPMGLFVPLIFWALYAVDRELIFPASMDVWFPSWLNHVMHTLPAIGVLIEVSLVCHFFQSGGKRFMPIIASYVLYLSWICYIAYAAGIWVYPIFEVLDFKSRTLFLASLLLPNVFLVHLGQIIHSLVWGTDKGHKKEGKKA